MNPTPKPGIPLIPDDGEARCDSTAWKDDCCCDFAAVDGIPARGIPLIDVELLARALAILRTPKAIENVWWTAEVYPKANLTEYGFADRIIEEYTRLASESSIPTGEYRAPIVDGEPCYWCDPQNGPCRIHPADLPVEEGDR